MRLPTLLTALFFTASVMLSSPASAATVCMLEQVYRTVDVVYSNPGQPLPCEVVYQKHGKLSTLWRADNEAGYCEKRAADFVAKLQALGWECSSQEAEQEAEQEGEEDQSATGEDEMNSPQAADRVAEEAANSSASESSYSNE